MLSADPRENVTSESQSQKLVKDLISRMTSLRHRFFKRVQDDSPNTAEQNLIGNIEDFVDLTAEDVMVPRIDIVAMQIDSTPEEFLELIKATPHSRIPVYQDSLDDVVGFIHIKDILRTMAHGDSIILRDMIRPAMIVSPAMPALDLLVEMRQTKRHLALVIDEYGGIDGLVTMGDLIEAIIGEISDEHNTTSKSPKLIQRSDGTILVDARYTIEAFEEQFGECFEENERNEADTLGGLAMFLAGRLPQRGEILTHSSGIQLEVVDSDPRRVKRLRIRDLEQRRKA
jgi:magnesium and cobalt transporter